ncbi:MAG: hypothetical protein GSR84_02235 [Desulfurococcales archaeon]|nr:hypothetical protein [Desulfurococcales archaeon]
MNSDCRLLVRGGASRIDEILDEVKYKIYEYNTRISDTGYYLKPVHKVYKRLSDGTLKIYEYYGRYYWRKQGNRLVYAGTEKPRSLPEPEPTPLEGLTLIRVGDDIIIECSVYDRYKDLFKGLEVERY